MLPNIDCDLESLPQPSAVDNEIGKSEMEGEGIQTHPGKAPRNIAMESQSDLEPGPVLAI